METASGLQYKVLRSGPEGGKSPLKNTPCLCHYKGKMSRFPQDPGVHIPTHLTLWKIQGFMISRVRVAIGRTHNALVLFPETAGYPTPRREGRP